MSIKGIAIVLAITALVAGATWYSTGGTISVSTSTSSPESPAATPPQTPPEAPPALAP